VLVKVINCLYNVDLTLVEDSKDDYYEYLISSIY